VVRQHIRQLGRPHAVFGLQRPRHALVLFLPAPGQNLEPADVAQHRVELVDLDRLGFALDRAGAYQVDQSAYLHLHTADELARSNARRVYRAMEFQ